MLAPRRGSWRGSRHWLARGVPRGCPSAVLLPSGKHTFASQPLRTVRPGQEQDRAQRLRQPATPRGVLLDGRDGAQDEHPGQAAEPDGEHHEHQRPAATDAEEAVGNAHEERLAALGNALPAVQHEPEWRAAFIETAVLERGELVEAGDGERRGQDDLGMRRQPRDRVDRGVDRAIADPRRQAGRRPDREIAEDGENDEQPRPTPAPDDRPERHEQRDRRRQHHRHDHHRPAHDEQAQLERGSEAGPGVVVEVTTVRRAIPYPQHDPRRRRDRHEERGEDRPIADRGAQVGRGEHGGAGSGSEAEVTLERVPALRFTFGRP